MAYHRQMKSANEVEQAETGNVGEIADLDFRIKIVPDIFEHAIEPAPIKDARRYRCGRPRR